MHILLFVFLILGSLVSHAETPLFLSLGFDSADTFREIPGVRVDLKNHRELAQETGLPFLQYTAADLAASGTKEQFLEKLRTSMDGHDEILFAYSGHGFNGDYKKEYVTAAKVMKTYTISPEEMAAMMASLDPEGKTDDQRLKSANRCPTQKRSDFLIGTKEGVGCLEKCLPQCQKKCSDANTEGQKPFVELETKCYASCKKKKDRKACQRECDSGNSKQREPVVEVFRKCKFECEENILQDPCGKQCKEKMITTDDLAKLFKGKKVTAIIDACHSGALKDFHQPHFSTWAAVDSESPTPDDAEKGGVLTKNFMETLRNNACELDSNKDGQITISEAFGKVDKDLKSGCVTGAPIDSMKDTVLKTIDRSKECSGSPQKGGQRVDQ